jgi:hypothetical protein
MPSKSRNIHGIKSEAEEAGWYATPEGRRQTEREFTRAVRTGSLSRSSGLKAAKTDPKVLEELMQRAKETATRAISIRVPIADLEHAARIANEIGVGYQTVLKRAIREGLKRV